MNLLFMDFDVTSASHRVRLEPLMSHANHLGYSSKFLMPSMTAKIPRLIKSIIGLIQIIWCDLFIVSKPLDERLRNKILIAKRLGKRVLVDLSDNHLLNNNLSKLQRQYLEESLFAADTITVPTNKVKDTLPIEFASKIFVIEDSIDIRCGEFISNVVMSDDKFVILWFGHSGFTEIRPTLSDSLGLFIEHTSSKFWSDFSEKRKLNLEFRIVSNSCEKIEELLSSKNDLKHPVNCYAWSIVEMKKQLSSANMVSLFYGDALLDSTKSSNRIELALYFGKPVMVNRILDAWDVKIKDYVFMETIGTEYELDSYLGKWSYLSQEASLYLENRQKIITKKWLNLLEGYTR
jgi:hypothetical protein